MGDHDKTIQEKAHELLNMLRAAFEAGYRIFDSKGNELKTISEVINKLSESDSIRVFYTDEEVKAHFEKKN